MADESIWLNHAKRLHALATTGLEFTDSYYEKDRYEEIQSISAALLADLSDKKVEKIAASLLDGIDGYVTPKTDVRAAVIREHKILLVQERTDKKWALPGGYADIGLSAAENAEKEVWEEAGIRVKTTKLYSYRHKAKGEYKADIRDFYKAFFLCDQIGEEDVIAGSEVLDARFFSLDELPELSTGRIVLSDLEAAFFHSNEQSAPTYYDI